MLNSEFGIKFFIICLFVFPNIKVSKTKHRFQNKEFGPKVVGGQPVQLEQYPFAVQFFNLGALCGGVILNSWSILTSAHCFDTNKDLDEMRVQIGSKYIYDFNAKKYQVHSYVVHENYNKEVPFEHDIALIFVEKPMKFNKLAKKAILINHNKWMNTREKNFIVTGWGWQKYGGELSESSLMMTYLTFVPVQQCSRLHKVKLTQDMFCLYGDGERDTCRGDSGGGVLWNGRIVGLTSHGDGCAKKDKPSVYANVWYLRGWIKKQVNQFILNFCDRQRKYPRADNFVIIKNRNNTI